MELRNQIAQSGVQVDVDAPKGQDMSRVMEEMRANYEKMAVKNAEELKAWHENQVTTYPLPISWIGCKRLDYLVHFCSQYPWKGYSFLSPFSMVSTAFATSLSLSLQDLRSSSPSLTEHGGPPGRTHGAE